MASLGALAGGAAEGLDTILARELLRQRQAEVIRSNHADEELKRSALTESSLVRGQAQKSLDASRESAAEDRASNNAWRAAAARPKGREMTPEAADAEMKHGVPADYFLKKYDKDFVGPTEDSRDTQVFQGIEHYVKPPDPDRTIVETDKGFRKRADITSDLEKGVPVHGKPPAPDRILVPTDQGYRTREDVTKDVKNGVTVNPKESAQILNRRDMATAVGSHFDDAQSMLDEAEKKGLLGPLKGRTFTDFMAGKIGSTGNKENDDLLGDLRASLGMIRSGTASLHGRSGANVGIAHDIEKKMDEGFMSHSEITGALRGLRKWVDTYATRPGAKKADGPARILYDTDGNPVTK